MDPTQRVEMIDFHQPFHGTIPNGPGHVIFDDIRISSISNASKNVLRIAFGNIQGISNVSFRVTKKPGHDAKFHSEHHFHELRHQFPLVANFLQSNAKNAVALPTSRTLPPFVLNGMRLQR